jgi:L-ascorbate 6-phosphate lactonase
VTLQISSEVELIWLGQAGYRVRVGATRVLIDPFLSEHEARLFPPPDLTEIGGPIDWVLVTHEHLDHLDISFLERLVLHFPDVRLVIPEPIADQLGDVIEASHVMAVQPEDIVELDGELRVEVVAAYHGREVADGYTDGSHIDGRVRFVGYILRTPAISIYHSGDTIVTDALLATLQSKSLDVALLPINGRDYFREEAGLVGNMNYREAVELALRSGVRILVPMHWDLFAGNTERPGAAVDVLAAQGAPMHVLNLARLVPFRLL